MEILEPRVDFEPEMVLIEDGPFLYGSNPEFDSDANIFEQPQEISVLPHYYLGRTPVTNMQYQAFLKNTGYKGHVRILGTDHPLHWMNGQPLKHKENHPVVNVSWYDALSYCKWLSSITHRQYWLPNELEWEKGARGTDGRIFPWGNVWDPSMCNSLESGLGDTTPVDQYPAGESPYGLLDMAGNAWEWTRSLWGRPRLDWGTDYWYPYNSSDGRENLYAPPTVRRIIRGGVFLYGRTGVRCAFRDWDHPFSLGFMGFRVLCVAEP